MISKVVSRDTFNYRKLTDEAIGEEEKSTEPKELEIDLEKLANGMLLIKVVCKKIS